MADQKPQFGDLFDKLGLAHLSDDQKAEYLAQWNDIVMDTVTSRVLENLNEQEKDEMEKIQDDDALMLFLHEKFPDFDGLLLNETMQFREGMIADAAYIRGKMSNWNPADTKSTEQSAPATNA